ncbi:MAG: hypothetical protein J7K22_04755 [Nanoarchaeota archaeon]|nr:hypothetical protein [Nanoarchaeota archaeon]
MKIYLLIGILLLFSVFALGCVGKQEKPENNTQIKKEEEKVVEQKEKPIYLCPLNTSKLKYTCETDEDCYMVSCQSGAGIVDTCVAKGTEYEGVETDLCVCKETGSYTVFENGTETTKVIKECRHV